MRELKVWLKDHKQDDEKFGEIGLPRDQVLKEYLEFYKLSLKTRTAVSILMEVRSFYVTESVLGVIRFGGQVVYAAADHRRTDISYSIGLV
jgi:hypothetical protein